MMTLLLARLPWRWRVRLQHFLGFTRFLIRRIREDQCPQVAGSLTFTTLLSLVPLFTIALTVFSALPDFAVMSTRFKVFLLKNFVPDLAGKIITVYMVQFAENAGRLTLLGLLMLLVTSISTMATIERSFNRIWRVTKPRPFFKRLLVYWAALTLGPLLLAGSLSLTSWFFVQASQWRSTSWLIDWFVLKPWPLLLLVSALTMLYVIVPRVFVPIRHALVASVITASALELMRWGLTWQISHFTTVKLVYGTFASLPVFLLWLYLVWVLVLVGAEICAALPAFRHADWTGQNHAGHDFWAALRILLLLEQALQHGQVMSFAALQYATRLADDRLLEILARLQKLALVTKNAADGWLLCRHPQHITMAELYRELVFSPPHVQQHGATASLKALLAPQLECIDQRLDLSLQSLVAAMQPEPDSENSAPSSAEPAPAHPASTDGANPP